MTLLRRVRRSRRRTPHQRTGAPAGVDRAWGGDVTVERRVRPYELVDGEFLEGSPTDLLGAVAQAFALNLVDAIAGRSTRAFERESGMSNASVVRILKGQVWPDAVTIARLEVATGRSLWPAYREGPTAGGPEDDAPGAADQ
jgi:hypothetical protein